MLREWKTEWMKVRYRKIGWILAAFMALIVIWAIWASDEATQDRIWDGYRMLFMQLPLINTILMPTMIAMLASRLCDAEVKGDTLKLLCTMERKGRLFDMKFLMGIVYLGLFMAAEVVFVLVMGHVYKYVRPLNFVQLLYFVLEVYVVNLVVYLLQQVLSFFFENQIIPLAVGLFGSFIGLFAWFFPGNPMRKLFIWGFYSQLCFVNYNWDETTRIMTYYDVPFDTEAFCLLLAVLVAGYVVGKFLFMRKEI